MNIKRLFDIFLSIFLGIISLPLIFILWPIVICTSEGSFIYWSKRIGVDGKIFFMPKIRTMVLDTPQVATHLLEDPASIYTPIGKLLRKFSLDELSQVYSVFIGDMSFVGPRPALYNQDDLIRLRTEKGIQKIRPGVTGWAQVNGRDRLSILEKVQYDEEYLIKASMGFDIYIIWLTIIKVIKKDGISH